MSSTKDPSTDHSACDDCDVRLPTREDAERHRSETLEIANLGRLKTDIRRGHRTRTINPTPEEVEERRIQTLVNIAVRDAMDACFEKLDRHIASGHITREQVASELRSTDFGDAWQEWCDGP